MSNRIYRFFQLSGLNCRLAFRPIEFLKCQEIKMPSRRSLPTLAALRTPSRQRSRTRSAWPIRPLSVRRVTRSCVNRRRSGLRLRYAEGADGLALGPFEFLKCQVIQNPPRRSLPTPTAWPVCSLLVRRMTRSTRRAQAASSAVAFPSVVRYEQRANGLALRRIESLTCQGISGIPESRLPLLPPHLHPPESPPGAQPDNKAPPAG